MVSGSCREPSDPPMGPDGSNSPRSPVPPSLSRKPAIVQHFRTRPESRSLSLSPRMRQSLPSVPPSPRIPTPSEVLEAARNSSNIPTALPTPLPATSTSFYDGAAKPQPRTNEPKSGPTPDIPTGEVKLEATLRRYDEERISRCNSDIDTLLVFAGLFSAVLATFNIQAYQILQPDPMTIYLPLLTQVVSQSLPTNLTRGSIPVSDSETPAFAVRVNVLWFASLICSLVAASLAMLVKQWFREYLNWDCTASDERIRVRHVRYAGLIRWRIFETAAILPLLLQLALVLFFLGLCEWIRAVNRTVWLFTLSFVAPWLLAFAVTVCAPLFSSSCPYKTPFLNSWIQACRVLISRLHGKQWRKKFHYSNSYYRFPGDERGVRRDLTLDIPALVSADKTLRDDDILFTSFRTCLQNVEGAKVLHITRKLFQHRLGRCVPYLHQLEYGRIPSRALESIAHILADALMRETNKTRSSWVLWMREATVCLASLLRHAQTHNRNVDASTFSSTFVSLLHLERSSLPELLAILAVGPPLVNWAAADFQPNSQSIVTPNVIHATRELIASIDRHHDPLRLTGEFLFIMEIMDSESLTRHFLQLNQVVIELSAAIWARGMTFGFQSTMLGGRSTSLYVELLLSACRRLNRRVKGLVGEDLVQILSQIYDDGAVSFHKGQTGGGTASRLTPVPQSNTTVSNNPLPAVYDTPHRPFVEGEGLFTGSDIQIFGRPSQRTSNLIFDWRPPTPLPSSALIQATTNFITNLRGPRSTSIRSFIVDLENESFGMVSRQSSSLSRDPLPLENETTSENTPIATGVNNPPYASIVPPFSTIGQLVPLPGMLPPVRRHTLDTTEPDTDLESHSQHSDHSDFTSSPIFRLASMSTPVLLPSHRDQSTDF